MLSVCLHFSIMMAIGLLYTVFFVFRYDASTPNVSRTFKFCDAFLALIEMIMLFLFLFVYIWFSIYWFTYVELILPLQGEAHLVITYNLLNVFQKSVWDYLIESFCIYVHQVNWSVVFSICCIFTWFDSKIILAS